MKAEDRRRIGAVAALVVGIFLGLVLVRAVPTGSVGRPLGDLLWRWLGAGAIGLPLLGAGIALAGFDRLPRLDMKRVTLLMVGLSLLIPFLIGVVTSSRPADFDPMLADWTVSARATGVVPGLLAYGVRQLIGQPGGVLLGLLALSALTIVTYGWHPFQRLEKRAAAVLPAAEPKAKKRAEAVGAPDETDEEETAPPLAREGRKPDLKLIKTAKPSSAAGPPGQPRNVDSELPPVTLLRSPVKQDTAADEAQLDKLGQLLLDTLKTFKVDGTISGRTSGPVVTQFEVVPASGVKAGRIVALSDDLAITMRAMSIRVAPIPGRGAVGVEVPNPTPRIVTLRELLESPEWERSRATLPVALGRDLEGKPVITDLSKNPHLLIAGATGTGKSVAINAIISCLVYKYTPKHLWLLMVDPKMVELSLYNALPHLRKKVITNNSQAAVVLKWAVGEMNHRYKLLHANGARNIADFNRKVADKEPLKNPLSETNTLAMISAEEETTPPEPPQSAEYTKGILPYIVIIVDELADLMMTVAAEVETPLALLAQKARAIGIHLILATQRPSVNVLTGLIKANFPSRISFRVASKVDSRTILDQNGAETLLGNGDMLFLPPGKSEPQRIQGAYITTEESESLMRWFGDHEPAIGATPAGWPAGEQDIIEVMRAQESEDDGPGEDEVADRDALFREAAEVCIQNQGGSTSLLQRRLKIGYGRAARIIDQLHFAGVLGPPDGSKPRDVLIGLDQLDEYCS